MLFNLGSFNKQSSSAIKEFLCKGELADKEKVEEIKRDIKRCYYKYKITPQEYFLFRLRNKSDPERNEYLPDHLIMKLAANKTGRKIHDTELNDKFNFYRINKPYFKREAFFFNRATKLEDFKKFAVSVDGFIAKPNGAALGSGVEIFRVKTERDAEKAFNRLQEYCVDYILEDLIRQSGDMAVWNRSSVNTIRINSFLTNGKFSVLCPFIRTGRKGSIVDNGGQGGIFASVDKETGRICTEGMDEKGNSYKAHPDPGIEYLGWQVPRWDELIKLSELVHRNMPRHVYVSWDFALSDNGWVLIEGNWGEFVAQQMTNRRGYKKDFKRLLNGK